MPLNKANFDGRSAPPTNDNIQWEVTFTVTDTSMGGSGGGGGGGTSQSQGGEVTKSASFPVTGGESAAEIAAALKDSWNSTNPEYRAMSSSGSEVVEFPDSASAQRYRVGSGEWQTLGPSISSLVDGVEVSDNA